MRMGTGASDLGVMDKQRGLWPEGVKDGFMRKGGGGVMGVRTQPWTRDIRRISELVICYWSVRGPQFCKAHS